MNYVESFYTGIVGNNYNLKVIKNKIFYIIPNQLLVNKNIKSLFWDF